MLISQPTFGPLLLAFCLFGSVQQSEFDQRVDGFVGNHVQVQAFLSKLQHAVAIHDAQTVATMTHYPIRVAPHRHSIRIRTRREFVAKYDFFMTPEITAAIRKQKYEHLFVRDQGAMIGGGQVWFTSYCLDKSCSSRDILLTTLQSAVPQK